MDSPIVPHRPLAVAASTCNRQGPSHVNTY